MYKIIEYNITQYNKIKPCKICQKQDCKHQISQHLQQQTQQQPAQQVQQMPHLNWLHFKPEFSGKPEDAEAHFLRTNNWMNTHQYPEDIKVQRFFQTQVGKARLWYESLRPINVDLQGLKNQFRKQYSKIGNTGEHLSHAWWSFHFDINRETLDAYVVCIRQVGTCLGCREPKIKKQGKKEVFKNTLPTKLYWVLFPIDDLRQVVETTQRLLTKEKIDRQ